MEDSEAVHDNEEDRVDLFSPIREKLKGLSLYAKKFKGNDDVRSVSSKSEAKSGTESETKSGRESETKSGTESPSLKSMEGTTRSSDNFSDTSASFKQSSTERRRNRNENLEQEMSSPIAESADHGEVPDNNDCSISSQSEVQAQQDTSVNSRIGNVSQPYHLSRKNICSEETKAIIFAIWPHKTNKHEPPSCSEEYRKENKMGEIR